MLRTGTAQTGADWLIVRQFNVDCILKEKTLEYICLYISIASFFVKKKITENTTCIRRRGYRNFFSIIRGQMLFGVQLRMDNNNNRARRYNVVIHLFTLFFIYSLLLFPICRNVTCYYYIRQAWSPKNQTILLTLVQSEPGQSFSVRTSDAGEKERKMMSGRECRTRVDDTVSIYNGATIESPLLARLCGTGNMPHITAAGGELLVVFRSQPHDAPFNPAPLGASPGFRLTTRVRFVAANQVRQYHPECRISITSSGSNSRRSQRQGIIRSPEATMAPNTSCLYEFTGREDQRVWMTYLSYRLDGGEDGDCLTMTDGQELVSRQCGAAVQPRICPHALVHANSSTAYKPCRWQDGESYLSRSPRFTIRQELATGTAIRPWSFVIRFEFITVDRFSPKEQLIAGQVKETLVHGGGGGGGTTTMTESPEASAGDDDDQQLTSQMMTPDCFQLLESSKGNGSVSSPRNPLLYGRGGSRHLRCLYRFQVYQQSISSAV